VYSILHGIAENLQAYTHHQKASFEETALEKIQLYLPPNKAKNNFRVTFTEINDKQVTAEFFRPRVQEPGSPVVL